MTLTVEQRELQALAREFAEGEIRAGAAEWDAARNLSDGILASLGELGFFGMRVPESHGGLGLDLPTYLLVLEQLAWGDAGVALAVAVQNGPVAELIGGHGDPVLQERWLPRIASGERRVAYSLAGAPHPASTGIVAKRDGEGWTLSGTRGWVTAGDHGHALLVLADTGDPDAGGTAAGLFLVDRQSPGYTVVRRERTMGLSASETVEVRLEAVRVDATDVVGDPSLGARYVGGCQGVVRAALAALSVGVAQAALEHATGYAAERRQFGRAIGEFEAIQYKLADMATRTTAARSLTHLAALRLGEAGPGHVGEGPHAEPDDPDVLAAMAKLTAQEAAVFATNQAVQIFGGYGYMRDYPVEKLMRDAQGAEVYAGAGDALRQVIARAIQGAPSVPNE